MFTRLRTVALLGLLASLPACETDECSANFVLGGAIEYMYGWRFPSTDCSIQSAPDLLTAAEIKFETGSDILIITSLDPLTVGAHVVDISYSTPTGRWTTDPYDANNPTVCVMTIAAAETVDWVQEDHLRIAGTVDCGPTGYLTSDELNGAGATLTISNLIFNVYKPDGGYI
jgi:hypothetical protein